MMNGQTALLRVRQMVEADRLTVAAGIPAIDMMESAGGAVAREIGRRWTARPVIVLCGPGNNGGDGFVASRDLVEAGWPVRIALLGQRDHLAGEARYHAERWRGAVEPLASAVLDGAELVVDAIFGAGLSRPLEGPAAETLAAANRRGPPTVAVDVPSGLMGDTGEVLGAVPALLTVAFFRKKPGHLLLPGRLLCGEVIVADIGTLPSVLEKIVPDTFENDPALWVSRSAAAAGRRQQIHARACADFRRLPDDWRRSDGGPRRSARRFRANDDRGVRDRSADLRDRADQHHGPTTRGTGRFQSRARRSSHLGFLNRPWRRRGRGDPRPGACHVGDRSPHATRRGCDHFLSRRSSCA
jgi:hydroxyethylthiazole kinase-like uncharacterized protein yjeF